MIIVRQKSIEILKKWKIKFEIIWNNLKVLRTWILILIQLQLNCKLKF